MKCRFSIFIQLGSIMLAMCGTSYLGLLEAVILLVWNNGTILRRYCDRQVVDCILRETYLVGSIKLSLWHRIAFLFPIMYLSQQEFVFICRPKKQQKLLFWWYKPFYFKLYLKPTNPAQKYLHLLWLHWTNLVGLPDNFYSIKRLVTLLKPEKFSALLSF